MSYIAAAFELAALYILGNKNKLGFIFNFIANGLWAAVAIKYGIYGLLFVVVSSMFLNVKNYRKWKNGEKKV